MVDQVKEILKREKKIDMHYQKAILSTLKKKWRRWVISKEENPPSYFHYNREYPPKYLENEGKKKV